MIPKSSPIPRTDSLPSSQPQPSRPRTPLHVPDIAMRPLQVDPLDPWYLTVVRTQGIQFLRAEKSCRPIATVNVVHQNHIDVSHETVLGCDGQNPNLKSPFVLREIDADTYLDITVFHKLAGKKRKKRHLIGSAHISVGELLKRQPRAGADVELKLSCPPPQKRSPTVGGNRQSGCASVTLRLRSPIPTASVTSSSVTAVDSPASSIHEDDDEILSEGPPSPASETTFSAPPQPTIRRRKKIKGYSVDTSDDEILSSPGSPTYPSFDIVWETEAELTASDPQQPVTVALPPSEDWIAPRVLPRYVDQMSLTGSFSVAETALDWFAPYKELSEAGEDVEFERVLGRLLTEWYVVGASLLAVAAVNAAVFGFSSGDTIFAVDGLAKRSIAFGSIAAGLGIVIDAWLLVMYSGANVRKFQRLALDVYGTYFFFSLTCRLPTLALFLSALSLMLFLLTVAWSAWPTAVLVMSFVAGTLVSLQYLVFGFHRCGNAVVWIGRKLLEVVGSAFGRRRQALSPLGSGQAVMVDASDTTVVPLPSRPRRSRSTAPSRSASRRRSADVAMPEPDTTSTGLVAPNPTSDASSSVK